MSKPANGAARNQMSEFERQCYDWGWQDAEARIINILEIEKTESGVTFFFANQIDTLIAIIEGESNLPFGGSETAILEGETE